MVDLYCNHLRFCYLNIFIFIPVNIPPVFLTSNNDTINLNVGVETQIDLEATDEDGDTLIFRYTGSLQKGQYTIDSESKILTSIYFLRLFMLIASHPNYTCMC